MKPYAHGYIRVSADERAKSGLGLQAQKEAIELWYSTVLKPQGVEWGGIFLEGKILPSGEVDPRGISASCIQFQRRPVGKELWKRMRAGDWVICAKLDRIVRNSQDFYNLVAELRQRKHHFQMLDIGEDLADTSSSKDLQAGIHALFAAYEAQRIGERTREAKAVKRRQGFCVNRAAPMGYKLRRTNKGDLVVEHCEETRKQMKLIWHLYTVEGMSRSDIIFYLLKHRIYKPYQKIQGRKGRLEWRTREWTDRGVRDALNAEKSRLESLGVEAPARPRRNAAS